MVEQAGKTRIDQARGKLRTALVEMAKAEAARHSDRSAEGGKAPAEESATGRATEGGQSAPSGQ